MGTIHLRAFHRGGKIVIQIQDDGNGLNKEKLLTKAREKDILKTLLDIDRVVSSVTLGNLVAA